MCFFEIVRSYYVEIDKLKGEYILNTRLPLISSLILLVSCSTNQESETLLGIEYLDKKSSSLGEVHVVDSKENRYQESELLSGIEYLDKKRNSLGRSHLVNGKENIDQDQLTDLKCVRNGLKLFYSRSEIEAIYQAVSKGGNTFKIDLKKYEKLNKYKSSWDRFEERAKLTDKRNKSKVAVSKCVLIYSNLTKVLNNEKDKNINTVVWNGKEYSIGDRVIYDGRKGSIISFKKREESGFLEKDYEQIQVARMKWDDPQKESSTAHVSYLTVITE